MVKQSKTRKPESFGKGKVTPIQIAFIVDRYLCDNNFSQTHTTFRNEASSIISNSPIKEVPKSLLSLGEMLDEYICLKEQKVMLDQQRILMEQERNRIQMLLQGMQNVMNVYNASGNLPVTNVPVPLNANSVVVPQPTIGNETPTASLVGVPTTSIITTQGTPKVLSGSAPSYINAENGNYSTPVVSLSNRKRKDPKGMDAPPTTKKYRGRSSSRKIPVQGQNTMPQTQTNNAVNNQIVSPPSSATQHSLGNCVPSGSQVQGSSVVKCLFNQPLVSSPTNSPVPKTPPRTISSHQSDTNISPTKIASAAPCNGDTTSTCFSVISTKRVMVSPAKQMAYIKSSHCISPVKTHSDKGSKRDHVRSRLDFDGSDMHMLERVGKPLCNEVSTYESNKQGDLDDLDFLIFNNMESNFSFSDMLHDLDLPCEVDFSYQPTSNHSKDNASGFSHEGKGKQVISESPSTVAEGLSEKDMNIQGPDCPTAIKSATTCKTMLSPEKKRQRGLDKENH